LIELGLRAAAMVVGRSAQRAAAQWRGTAELKLLALGDSNTYGLGVNEREAYPRVLETLWNADPKLPRIEVINLGYPGTNSSMLRNRFAKLLSMLRPDIVTVMIGANDFWTPAEPVNDETDWRENLDFLAWRSSRLYRLLSMLRRAFQDVQLDIPRSVERGGQPLVVQLGPERVELLLNPSNPSDVEGRPSLGDNLVALARDAAQADVELILLTYPADAKHTAVYTRTNTQIRAAAATAGIRLIDLTAISRFCTKRECDELMWDYHPTALGHQLAADLIVGTLSRWTVATR
jgi:lysophospholipase L1-like esterase